MDAPVGVGSLRPRFGRPAVLPRRPFVQADTRMPRPRKHDARRLLRDDVADDPVAEPRRPPQEAVKARTEIRRAREELAGERDAKTRPGWKWREARHATMH